MSVFETLAVIYFTALLLNIALILVLAGGFMAYCLARERYRMWQGWKTVTRSRSLGGSEH